MAHRSLILFHRQKHTIWSQFCILQCSVQSLSHLYDVQQRTVDKPRLADFVMRSIPLDPAFLLKLQVCLVYLDFSHVIQTVLIV